MFIHFERGLCTPREYASRISLSFVWKSDTKHKHHLPPPGTCFSQNQLIGQWTSRNVLLFMWLWVGDWRGMLVKEWLILFVAFFCEWCIVWLTAYLACVCLPLAINLSFPYDWFSGLGIFTDILNCNAPHPTFPSVFAFVMSFSNGSTELKIKTLERNVRPSRYQYCCPVFTDNIPLCSQTKGS
jgi:hypothetical protein